MSVLETAAVPSSVQNRRVFRQVARQSSGASYDAADGDRLVFGSVTDHGRRVVIAVASYRPADPVDAAPADSGHTHELNYLFVQPRHKGIGHGSALLAAVEAQMTLRCPRRPVHVESARGAVRFFEKHGYHAVGKPVDCICSGSQLFAQLQHMQKAAPST